MTADVTIAGERLTAHPLRAAVLGEVHARPFTPIETPRRVLHFAFETTGERGEADRVALVAFCASRGLNEPDRKSTRLNSSHEWISYAVFCLKKKKYISPTRTT